MPGKTPVCKGNTRTAPEILRMGNFISKHIPVKKTGVIANVMD